MADLLDIAPSTSCEAFRLTGGARLVVRGLNSNAVASIAARYPKIIGFFFGGFDVADLQQPQTILQFGETVAPIIAAGCGNLADPEAERRADNLLLEDQIKLVVIIWRLTFPNGLASFVNAVTALLPGASADEGEKIHTIRRFRKSPLPSQPSSEEASRQNLQ